MTDVHETRCPALGILRDLETAVQESPPGGRIIFSHLAGSHLYGMSGPESDVDVRAIHQARTDGLFRMTPSFGGRRSTIAIDGHDAVSTEVGKFCDLACHGNPSVLEMLFVPEWAVLTTTPEFVGLMSIRDAFLSQRIIPAYLGYTWSNLSQAVNHIFRAIEQRDQGLADQLLEVQGWGSMAGLLGCLDSFEKLNLLDVCDIDWAIAEGTRAYKASAHVMRLLVCLRNFVLTGQFSVDLGDDLELVRSIRTGTMSLEDFLAEVMARRHALDSLVSSDQAHPLPERPDEDRVDEVLITLRRRDLEI